MAVLVAQSESLIGAGVGPLQSERGLAQYSSVHACAMLSSLVAPHGSTLFWRNEHERLQENPRRDRRRRHARRNRPRLHPGLRRLLQLWLRRIWIWRRVWLQPALVRLQQLFLLRLQLLWLWPSELRLWLRPPLLVTAEFPGFHPSRQALAAADAAWGTAPQEMEALGPHALFPRELRPGRTHLTHEPSRAVDRQTHQDHSLNRR